MIPPAGTGSIPFPAILPLRTYQTQFYGLSRANAGGPATKLKPSAADLLDAVQAIVDAFGDQDSLLIDQCKSALRKAKGEA